MFGACGRKVDAEIAKEYARVYCDQIDREAKLSGKATLMDARIRLCRNCQFVDRRPWTTLNQNKKEK